MDWIASQQCLPCPSPGKRACLSILISMAVDLNCEFHIILGSMCTSVRDSGSPASSAFKGLLSESLNTKQLSLLSSYIWNIFSAKFCRFLTWVFAVFNPKVIAESKQNNHLLQNTFEWQMDKYHWSFPNIRAAQSWCHIPSSCPHSSSTTMPSSPTHKCFLL